MGHPWPVSWREQAGIKVVKVGWEAMFLAAGAREKTESGRP